MKITICGSMLFLPQMQEMMEVLEFNGHEVVIPFTTEGEKVQNGNYLKQWHGEDGEISIVSPNDEVWDIKKSSILSYFEKVLDADAILVANYTKNDIEGYVGGNTLMEMGMALNAGKIIYLLNLPDISKLSYGEEIFGCRPIILGGSISCLLKQCEQREI